MIAEEPERYQAGDMAGLSGLQARYDEQLRGSPGVVVDAVGRDGQERELFRVRSREPGTPLRAHPGRRPADRGRAALAERRPGQRAGGDPAQRRATIRRGGQRPRHNGAQPGDLRPGRPGLDVQDRQQPGAAALRADSRRRR